MNTYLGMSREDLEKLFIYNREEGIVLSKTTGKVVGSETPSGLVVKKRFEKRVVTFSLGKMCYFLNTDSQLADSDMISYKDQDFYNLRPDNLVVVKYVKPKEQDLIQPFVVVEQGILFNPNKSEFVVRRGHNQAVYRCSSLKEAISIRKEWESDKKIHKWDYTVAKYRRYLTN